MSRRMTSIAKDIAATIPLNDGVNMPILGLGLNKVSSGVGGEAEKAVEYAISQGYRLMDTAEFYQNEEDVGRGIKNSGIKREDMFVVSKLWENGYRRCMKIFNESLQKLDTKYADLYLIHSPASGKVVETYKAMLELKEQGLIRSVGVSNFGVHHLEGLKSAGLPKPSVNQIELHPWQQKLEIVKYCRANEITVMGHCPLAKGQRFDDKTLNEIANKYKKTPAQILIRWSVQHGYITIPKSAKPQRIAENMQVFEWSLDEEDMAQLDSFPDKSCSWNPCISPWTG